MSIGLKLKINSDSSNFTENLGQKLGNNLRGGEVIQLTSDLGGGKTTFTCGLAKGAGSTDTVSSPTFTISKIYKTPRFNINHFDFYRLNNPGLIKYELAELINNHREVIIVEWADIISEILPVNTLNIKIKYTGDNSRQIILSYNKFNKHLIKGLVE